MLRIPAALLVAVLAALAPRAHAQAAAPANPSASAPDAMPTWYTERLLTARGGPTIEHLWSKGPWLRSELVVAGQPIVQLVKGNRYVILNRVQHRGVSIERNPRAIANDAAGRRPFADDRDLIVAAGGERVGTQKVAGQECEVYRVTDRDGRRETCVTAEGLPIRTEMWHRASASSSEASYLTWARDVPLPDDFFDPDPGVVLETYGYEQYLEAVKNGPVGPSPPLHSFLLHGQ